MTPASRPAILSAEGLGYRAPFGRSLLRDVTLSIEPGERLAIVGPNGAGKTTLLHMLCGMLRPSSGAISLLGQPLAALKPAERARRIAVVGQADQPDRRIALGDYVALGRIPHGGAMPRREELALIDDALARCGLAALARREMGSLSGGERQRAQIARAIVQQPQLLFLDEPTNHLDPQARGLLLGLVADLGLTVIAVLHDLHLVPGFATKVAIIKDGTLVTSGPPQQALSRHAVRDVFGIDLLRLPHPHEDRELTIFDIPFPHDLGARPS